MSVYAFSFSPHDMLFLFVQLTRFHTLFLSPDNYLKSLVENKNIKQSFVCSSPFLMARLQPYI